MLYILTFIEQQEDGTPYIQSLEVALVMKYRQTQGFTVMSKGEFASLEDMKYYDTKCKAHMALKETVKMLELQGGLAEGVMVINYSLDPPLLAAKGNDVSEAS